MDHDFRIDWLCERCGGVTTAEYRCRCQQPHDPVAARRRHREAVLRARRTDDALLRRAARAPEHRPSRAA